MSNSSDSWAIIAKVDLSVLAREASVTWKSEVTPGGSPPPWRGQIRSSGEAILIGDEPGLQGCFDLWAKALTRALKTRVLVLDWNPEFLQVFEGLNGEVRERRDLNALELAVQFGLLPTPAHSVYRGLLVIEGGTAEALLQALDLSEMPSALRTKEVSGGLAVWSVAEKGGVAAILHEASFIGRCYALFWGPPPREFACNIVVDGEDIGWFEIPGPGPRGVPALDNVLGKDSPNDICEILGVRDFAQSAPES